jgi:hypothetical protein
MSYILSGKGDDSSYIYNYQVINVIDNFSLQIKKDDNKINYILNIKRDNDDKYLDMLINLSLEYSNSYNNDNSFVSNDYISYDDMNIEDREKVNNYVFKIYYSLYNLLVYNK